MKERRFSLRLPPSLYEGIQVLARIKHRSMNQMILYALQKEMIRNAEEITQELKKQKRDKPA